MRAPDCCKWVAAAMVCASAAGCGHRQQVAYTPPPPSISSPVSSSASRPHPAEPAAVGQGMPESPQTSVVAADDRDAEIVATHQPIYTETGVASWYGPPYHNHRGANGQIFNQNAMTAAHRTLPMNSLIKATNLATGQSVIVRVTDRGPFVGDRFLDLSVASAKAAGVWLPGTAQMKLEVYEAPKPIEEGGRWCVQVGAFDSGRKSESLAHHLEKKYRTANVVEFTGPTGHWVRIRPLNDDKSKAIEIEAELKPDQGRAYLVRLD